MTLAGFLLIAMLIMKRWPDTAAARWLQRTLVVQPLTAIARIKRRHIIMLLVGLLALQAAATMGAPHLAMAFAIDLSAYFDAVLTVWTVAALTRSKGAWTAMRAPLGAILRRGQPRRRRRRVGPMADRRGANDDEDGASVFARAA